MMTNKILCKASQCSPWVYSYLGFLTGSLRKSFFKHITVTIVCWWDEAKLLLVISPVQEKRLFFIARVALVPCTV